MRPHVSRLRGGRGELLWRDDVWQELQRRDAGVAVVSFAGRAGLGRRIGRITLRCRRGDELVDVELWSGRDELAYALEGPVWDRYAEFAGHPWVRATLAWTLSDRSVVIVGRRGGQPFEEQIT